MSEPGTSSRPLRKRKSSNESIPGSWKVQFPWLDVDPSGSSKAYCTYCGVVLDRNIQKLESHETSEGHQGACPNYYEVVVDPNDEETKNEEKDPDYKSTETEMFSSDEAKNDELINGRRFQESWKINFPWVERDPNGSAKAYCRFCQKLLRPKVTNIKDHERTARHKNLCPKGLTNTEAGNDDTPRGTSIKTKATKRPSPSIQRKFISMYAWAESDPEGSEKIFCDPCQVLLDPVEDLISGHHFSAHDKRAKEELKEVNSTLEEIISATILSNPEKETANEDSDAPVDIEEPVAGQYSWATSDPRINEKIFCPLCKVFIEPRAANLDAHEKTVKHIRLIKKGNNPVQEKNTTVVCDGFVKFVGDVEIREVVEPEPPLPKGQRRFKEEWTNQFSWLIRDPDGTHKAFCKLCEKYLTPKLSNLVTHEATYVHKKKSGLVVPKPPKIWSYPNLKPTPRKGGAFRCMSCTDSFASQKDLFFHLKDHYEPESSRQEEIVQIIQTNTESVTVAEDSAPKDSSPHKSYQKDWVKKFPWLTEDGANSEMGTCGMCDVKIRLNYYYIKKHEKSIEHKTSVDPNYVPSQEEETRNTKGPIAALVAKCGNVQDNRGQIKYECAICHKLFNRNSLSIHMRIHQDLRPFKCDKCEWAFRQANDLKAHIQSIHLKLLPYQCEFCGSSFARKSSLRLHQKIHTGVRDHICDICRHGFRSRGKMLEHRRVHTGEKPYACDICGSSFRVKSDMMRHRSNVHLKSSNGMQQKQKIKKREQEQEQTPSDTDESLQAEENQEVELNFDGIQGQELVFIGPNEAIFVTKSRR